MLQTEKIETARLVMLPLNLEYAQVVFDNFTDELTTFLISSAPKKIAETMKFIEMAMRQRSEKTDLVYAIHLKATNDFLGLTGLHHLQNESPEFGIWIKKDAHSNHYGREAIGGLMVLAKQLGYSKAIYPVDWRNEASKKIPLYYNGVQILERKEHATFSNGILEIDTYEISL